MKYVIPVQYKSVIMLHAQYLAEVKGNTCLSHVFVMASGAVYIIYASIYLETIPKAPGDLPVHRYRVIP